MTPLPVRRDARENRERILAIARRVVDEDQPLQLNDVARSAGLGVATVYRHFPTPEVLVQALAQDRLAALLEDDPAPEDPWADLVAFLTAGLAAQLDDRALASALSSASSVSLRSALLARLDLLLTRAQNAGRARAGLDGTDLLALMCGVVTATRSHAPDQPQDQLATGQRYLALLLDGMRPR